MRLANNAFGCDSKRFVPRMDINMFFEFFQEKGTMPYIGIRRQIVPHLNQMDMFALQSQMDGTFRTGQAAAKDHNFVADRILFLVVIVDQNYLLSIQSGNRVGNCGSEN